MFGKCDVLRIHLIFYDDNNLTYYDKRTLKERFIHGFPNEESNNIP